MRKASSPLLSLILTACSAPTSWFAAGHLHADTLSHLRSKVHHILAAQEKDHAEQNLAEQIHVEAEEEEQRAAEKECEKGS